MPNVTVSPKERAFLAFCGTIPATSLPHLVGGELESAGSGDLSPFFSQFDDDAATLKTRPAAYTDGLRSVCSSALRGARTDLQVRTAFFDVFVFSDFVFVTSQVPLGFDCDAAPVLPFAILRDCTIPPALFLNVPLNLQPSYTVMLLSYVAFCVSELLWAKHPLWLDLTIRWAQYTRDGLLAVVLPGDYARLPEMAHALVACVLSSGMHNAPEYWPSSLLEAQILKDALRLRTGKDFSLTSGDRWSMLPFAEPCPECVRARRNFSRGCPRICSLQYGRPNRLCCGCFDNHGTGCRFNAKVCVSFSLSASHADLLQFEAEAALSRREETPDPESEEGVDGALEEDEGSEMGSQASRPVASSSRRSARGRSSGGKTAKDSSAPGRRRQPARQVVSPRKRRRVVSTSPEAESSGAEEVVDDAGEDAGMVFSVCLLSPFLTLPSRRRARSYGR